MRRKPSQGVAGARDVPRDDVRLDGIPRLGANQRPRLTRPRPPRPTPPRLAGVRNAYAAHADGATGFYVDEGSTYTNPHDGGVREALVRAVRAWPDLFAPADQPGSTADDRILDLSCGSGEVTAALVAAGVHLDRIDACDPYTGAAYERRIGKKCANLPPPRNPRVVHGDAFPLLQWTRESIPRRRPVRYSLTRTSLDVPFPDPQSRDLVLRGHRARRRRRQKLARGHLFIRHAPLRSGLPPDAVHDARGEHGCAHRPHAAQAARVGPRVGMVPVARVEGYVLEDTHAEIRDGGRGTPAGFHRPRGGAGGGFGR